MKTLIRLTSAAVIAACALSGNAQAQPRYDYYQPHYYYGDECRDQNAAAGAVAGAIIGGILGSQVRGHDRGAATVGGVILGGLAGSAIARDMDCRDRPYAFRAYSRGFDGPIGRRYDWYNDRRTAYGTFIPTREYYRRGVTCRDFQEDRYVRGRHHSRYGTACRERDGNWHFR